MVMILFRYEFGMGNLFVLIWARVRLWECWFGVMYVGWYIVCDLVVFSEVFVDYYSLFVLMSVV